MISYDNYKNRIEKLAKVKKFILKFKFLILGVLALIIAGVTVILCIKGTVTAPLTLPAQIIYGDNYEPQGASAIMSGITYEYKAENGEWTKEKPIKAGKYSARAVAEKVFGAKCYGDAVEYEILPKEAHFVINDDSVIYGDNPADFTLSPLVYGDKLQKESLFFGFKDFLTQETDVTVDISSIKITDINGGDSSSCYKITTEQKAVRLIERKLSVKPAALQFVYCGEEIPFENLASEQTLSMLAKGDNLSFDTVLKDKKGNEISKPKLAGVYTIEVVPESIQIFKGETDVTSRYGLGTHKENLTVAQKPITIKTAGKSKQFDASPIFDGGYSEQGLISGHTLVRDNAPLVSFTDVNKSLNVQNFAIFDGQSAEVTENYAINYEYGTLEITPKIINVTTQSDNKIYDGTPLINNNYQDDLRLTGYSLSLKSSAKMEDAGEKENVLTFSVSAPDGSDASGNFKINYNYGKLTVYRRKITVTTESGNAVFNGNYLYKTNGTVSPSTPLASGQQIFCAQPFGIKDVAYNVENKTAFNVKNGVRDVTGNYDISYIYGTLSVTPRPISVTTVNSTHVYDAKEFYDYGYSTRLSGSTTESGLVGGDNLSIVSYEKITNAGTVVNRCVYDVPNANYEIKNYSYGTLTVRPRPLLVVTVSNNSHIYDATAFSDAGYQTYYYGDNTKQGLLNGDGLTVKTFKSVTNALNYVANECTYDVPNANYEIKDYSYGILVVQPRPLTVKTADAGKVYDGIPLSKPDGYSVEYYGDNSKQGLLNGDSLTLKTFNSIVNATNFAENECTYDVPNANYDIKEYIYGTLIITPRPITVITNTNESHIYDATVFSDAGYQTHYYGDNTKKGLLNGDTLSVNSCTEVVNAETKINYCDYSVNLNYEIKSYKYGKITVLPRPITVITNTNASHIYDATAFSDTGYQTHYYGDNTKQGLLNPDSLTVKTFSSVTDALQPVRNNCTYAVGGNYEIKDYVYGTLTVQPRPITVKTGYVTKVYDSLPLNGGGSYKTYYYGDESAAGLLGNDRLTLEFNDSIINVWENKPNESRYKEPNKNYVIKSYEHGALEVTPRPLLVETASASRFYSGAAFSYPQYKTYYHGNGKTAGLLGGDRLILINAAAVTNVWDTRENNNVCSFNAPNANYEIKDYSYGTLTIEKKWLSIIPYDCNTLYGSRNTYLNGVDNYIVGYADDVTVSGEKLEIEVYFENANGDKVTPKNAGQYKIFVDGEKGKIYKDGIYFQRGIENYLLCHTDCGTLTVKPRPITVKANDVTLDYGTTDFYALTQNNFENAEGCGLQYDDTLQIVVSFEQNGISVTPKNVGSYNICPVGALTLINGIPDTSNYDITYVNGALTINPKEITVELLSQSFFYGDTAAYPVYENNFENAADCQLQYNEKLTVYTQYKQNGVAVTPKNCGTYYICAIESQTLINGIADTGNYDITYIDGVLRILQKHIEITLFDVAPVTYGTQLSYPSGIGNFENYLTCGLQYGEQLEIVVVFKNEKGETFSSPKNAGKYSYGLSAASVFDKDGNAIPQGELNYVFSVPEKQTEILPKAIKVQPYYFISAQNHPEYGALSYLTYGDNFAYPSGAGNFRFAATCGLEYGDELEIFVEYAYRDYPDYFYSDIPPADAGLYRIRAKESATLVNGVADTSNYDITYVEGQLKIVPKRIEAELNDISSVYGEPLFYPEYNNNFKNADSCGLQYNEALQIINASFDVPQSVPNVGSYAVSANEARIFNADGTEGKISNYIVTFVGSTLTVTPRPLTVETFGAEKEYDGIPLFNKNYKTYYLSPENQGLLNGDVLTLLTFTEEVNAGDYANICTYEVPDGNYVIKDYKYGTLSVTPRRIAVITADGKKVYDGTPLSNTAYNTRHYDYTDKKGLLNGDTLTLEFEFEIVNAGTELNACIFGANSNYEIIGYDYGNLTVDKAPLNILLNTVTTEYGEAYPAGADNFLNPESCGLVNGEKLEVALSYTQNGVQVVPKNVGEYSITLYENDCVVYDKNKNVIQNGINNYDISYSGGSLTINVKMLDIDMFGVVNVYGEPYEYPAGLGNFINPETCGLQYGEQLSLTVVFKEEPATFDVGEYSVTPSVLLPCIYDAEGNLIDSGDKNYGYNYLLKNVKVIPRPLTIVTNSAQKVYNGLPLSDGGYQTYYFAQPEKAGLIKGDVLSALSVKQITNVWETSENNNICEYSLPNGNYEIAEIIYGTLQITPKEIAIVLSDIGAVNYGETLVYPAGKGNYFNTSFIGLENGEQIEVSVIFSQNGSPVTPKNAGNYDYSLDFDGTTVYAADRTEIINGINNYSIICLDKTAEIARRVLSVSLTGIQNTVYDGYVRPYPAGGFVFVSDTKPAYGESLALGFKYYSDALLTSVTGTPRNAGKYFICVDENACTASGESVYAAALNYIILCEDCVSYEIYKKALTLTLGNVSKDYDGEPFDFDTAPASAFAVTGLCGTDELKRTVTYSDNPLNAGTYAVAFDEAAFELSKGITTNYYLDTSSGKLNCSLTINKRKIYVEVNDRQTEFSGAPVNPEDESFLSYYFDNNSQEGFVKDDAENAGIVYRYNGSTVPPSAIGRYALSVEFTNTAVTDNYIVATNTPAELVITARKVGVKAIYKNGTFYYNGEPVAISDFGIESWHDIENPASGDEYGFADADLPAITATAEYTFRSADGTIFKDGATPVNAGKYSLELVISGYAENEYFVTCYESEFVINKRPLAITVGDMETVYENKKPSGVPEISAKFAFDTLQDGLLAKDVSKYTVTHKFTTSSSGSIGRYNAGTYLITAELNRLTDEDNYIIYAVNKGTLTIKRATLYVKPLDKSEYYNGNNIVIGLKDYVIFGSDENGAFALAQGDYLFVEADAELTPAKAVQKVVLTKAWVRNADSYNGSFGADITANYNIFTAYSEEMGEEYFKSSFYGYLAYEARKVLFEQTVPAGQSSFIYDGETKSITYTDESKLYKDVSSANGAIGLYAGHRLAVKSAKIGKEVGVYKDWLRLKVYDAASGADVTKLYSIECVNAETAAVEIKAINATLSIGSSVTLSALDSGSVLSVSQYGDYNVLNSSEYSVTGLPQGYSAEIMVENNGAGYTFKVLLFELRESFGTVSRKEKSHCFNLTVNKPAGLAVNIVKSEIPRD